MPFWKHSGAVSSDPAGCDWYLAAAPRTSATCAQARPGDLEEAVPGAARCLVFPPAHALSVGRDLSVGGRGQAARTDTGTSGDRARGGSSAFSPETRRGPPWLWLRVSRRADAASTALLRWRPLLRQTAAGTGGASQASSAVPAAPPFVFSALRVHEEAFATRIAGRAGQGAAAALSGPGLLATVLPVADRAALLDCTLQATAADTDLN